MNKSILLILLVFSCLPLRLTAQSSPESQDGYAYVKNDLLTIGNSKIERVYHWNKGQIRTRSLTDKITGTTWYPENAKPDFVLPGDTLSVGEAAFSSCFMQETAIAPAHLKVEITCLLGKLEVKRVFRVYPGCPAIACDFYYRGQSSNSWLQEGMKQGDLVNLEKLTSHKEADSFPVIECLELPGRHWRLRAVEFFDITDRCNNLVREVEALSYRPASFRGNVLLAFDNVSRNGVFFLKESPVSGVQLAYPGGDFLTAYGNLKVVGTGINPEDLDVKEWKRGYGFVTGVYSQDSRNGLQALRNYQKKVRILKEGRDEMILMNTWGDRGQDTRLGERFALAELEAGAKLGITHFQLDDGWQQGRSGNSAFKGGSFKSIWSNPHYWDVDPEKFPHGLEPIVKKGKELGIEVCLWFNPSPDNDMDDWEKDADALIRLYNKYGTRTFKIDGVNLPTKIAEHNFRKFLDKVSTHTAYNAVFNLDVTAHRRGGYHYFNEYGNLFLENRYTDWQNYYPYTTLRNLWMLSQYVPAEKLQIEFLNKWRNTANYKGDPYAPEHYSFEYLFAVTMAAQPLAWFEGAGLPSEAIKEIAPVIRKYRQVQYDLHRGDIFPIGEEPSGRSWTGFQSMQEGRGYFLVFREDNELTGKEIQTWLQPGAKVDCKRVMGQGKDFTAIVGPDGKLTFELPQKNSYSLYTYSIK